MKKVFVKKAVSCVMMLMFVSTMPAVSYGMAEQEEGYIISAGNSVERADHIEYVYMVDGNGVEWKRLYNFTKGDWEEKYWSLA